MTFKELEQLVKELQSMVGELPEKLEEKKDDPTEKIEELELLIRNHKHQGNDTSLLFEAITTVDTVPSGTPPKRLTKQIYIYISGGTKRLYIYDFTNAAWKYASLT